MSFTWGPLAGAPFLPRVRINRVIVQRAQWSLDTSDLAELTAAVKAAGKAKPGEGRVRVETAVAALRERHRLPRFVMIAAGDNELPIDLDNPLLVAAFADELAGAPGVMLTEMFPAPDQLVARGPEGRFANEIVVTFTRKRPATRSVARAPAPATRRVFAPGSEWLYKWSPSRRQLMGITYGSPFTIQPSRATRATSNSRLASSLFSIFIIAISTRQELYPQEIA